MQRNFTQGKITINILLFALPLMAGNLLQQMYNITDTWIVGHYLGSGTLGAVGSAYTLMVFLTSIILGLCMGGGAVVSMQYGENNMPKMRRSIFMSFMFILAATLVLNAMVYIFDDFILYILRVPDQIRQLMKDYLLIIYAGITATFLYNYCSAVLRAIGNSVTPLIFLAVSAVLNVFLDIYLVAVVGWGVKGAGIATVFSQFVSGVGILIYTLKKFTELVPQKEDRKWNKGEFAAVLNLSAMTCLQQSIMNFGILMVQGLVNSFGTAVMAAFAAAVKIDSFAYMPVQDFGNAFSTFVAQNYGADNKQRINKGVVSAAVTSAVFCVIISTLVFIFAKPLMQIFISPSETEVVNIGINYLRIEGSCYIGIGILFLLYGYYRAVDKPLMSVILTVLSLGTRVLLAYLLSAISFIGVTGIWLSVPIGWFLADIVGVLAYLYGQRKNKG